MYKHMHLHRIRIFAQRNPFQGRTWTHLRGKRHADAGHASGEETPAGDAARDPGGAAAALAGRWRAVALLPIATTASPSRLFTQNCPEEFTMDVAAGSSMMLAAWPVHILLREALFRKRVGVALLLERRQHEKCAREQNARAEVSHNQSRAPIGDHIRIFHLNELPKIIPLML